MAPRGGRFSAQLAATIGNQALNTFNTLNIYVLRGEGAAGMNLTFDSLMVRALDEPDALYGLLARSVAVSPDGLTYTLRAAPAGAVPRRLAADRAATPPSASSSCATRAIPRSREVIRDMTDARAEGDETARRHLRARTAPATCRCSWRSCRSSRRPITAAATSRPRRLEPPLGSGPYRVGRVDPGRSIGLERVPDYWAADLPVNVGQNNFDAIRYEYFRDRHRGVRGVQERRLHLPRGVHRPGLGHRLRLPGARREAGSSARPCRMRGPAGTQGWWINTRREAFRDPGCARRSACASTSNGRTAT